MNRRKRRDFLYKPKRDSWRSLIYLMLAGYAAMGLGMPFVYAQEQEPWTSPIPLSQGVMDTSGASMRSSFPVLVADDYGDVHAFWPTLPSTQVGTLTESMVMYSRWDGSSWSTPVDILYRSANPFWLPQVVLDPEGWFHLVWRDSAGHRVWYSHAPATEAASARAWSKPQQVLDVVASGIAIASDTDGIIHLVYCTEDDEKVYYIRSADGETWSTPAEIWEPCDFCSPRLAIDDRGRFHAVFGSQGVGGAAVYYARSDDGGESWLPAMELDHVDGRYSEEYGPAHVNVAAIGGDEVHLVWDGAPAGQRWHQWSTDGGQTWSVPQQISPDHRGLTLPVAMAVDSRGTLHLISMGWLDTPEHPHGAFHTYWQDGRWSPLVFIGDVPGSDHEYPALAISGGNTLHAAWTEKFSNSTVLEIWTSSLEIDALAIPPKPRPPLATPTSTATTANRISSPMAPTETTGDSESSGIADLNSGLGTQPNEPTWWPVLVSIVSLLSLVALIIVVRLSRQHQR